MAFTELYVTNASGNSNQNGGSGTGAPRASAVSADLVSNANLALYTITRSSGSWVDDGVVVGDFGLWDCDNGTVASRRSYYVNEVTSTTILTVTVPSAIGNATKNTIIGGAWNLPSVAGIFTSQWAATTWPAGINPPRVNIKNWNGTGVDYSETIRSTWSFVGTAAIPLTVEGYVDNAGDINPWTAESRAYINNTGTEGFFVSGAYAIVKNIKFVSAYYDFYVTNGYQTFWNCYGSHSAAGTYSAFYIDCTYCCFIRCVGERTANGTGNCFLSAQSSHSFQGCVAIGPGQAASRGNGFSLAATSSLFSCIAYNCSNGFLITLYSNNIINCVAGKCVDGISMTGTAAQAVSNTLLNCKIADNTGYGINNTNAGIFTRLHHNEFGSGDHVNASGDYAATLTVPDVTSNKTSSLPFVDVATYDFRCPSTSSGKASGFPGELGVGGTTWTGYIDIGALQHQDTGGASRVVLGGVVH